MIEKLGIKNCFKKFIYGIYIMHLSFNSLINYKNNVKIKYSERLQAKEAMGSHRFGFIPPQLQRHENYEALGTIMGGEQVCSRQVHYRISMVHTVPRQDTRYHKLPQGEAGRGP